MQPPSPAVTATDFWDRLYAGSEELQTMDKRVLDAALDHFGDIGGKTILDLGCGRGTSSLYFASRGARVIAVDYSSVAIDALNARCAEHGIENVRGICGNAAALEGQEQVDFVFGSMILHHIEPFDPFTRQLRNILRPGGRAFFYENNAASGLLMWVRQHVVGRLWVPKRGDPDEFPLTTEEIELLRRYFRATIIYPEMLFFALVGEYVFRGALVKPFYALDRLFYERQWLLRYSYRQYVLLS